MTEALLSTALPLLAAKSTDAVVVRLRERIGLARIGESVTLGIPLPRGMARPEEHWGIRGESEAGEPCQIRPLGLWSDGSVKWMLTSFSASCEALDSRRVELVKGEFASSLGAIAAVRRQADRLDVETSAATFSLPLHGDVLLAQASVGAQDVLCQSGLTVELTDRRGRVHPVHVDEVEVLEEGPLRVQVGFRGQLARLGLNCFGEWTFHAGSALAQMEITLHNPSRARHARGCWELGDPGSVCFREFGLRAALGGAGPGHVYWNEDGSGVWTNRCNGELEIYQDSSGGEAYRSRNHIAASGKVPISFRGYRVRCEGSERVGLRAQPIVAAGRDECWLAATVAEFWQQFPTSIAASEAGVQIGLMSGQFAELHELQGGEQKTFRIALRFGSSGEPDPAPLAGCLNALESRCDLRWLHATGAIANLPPSAQSLRPEWREVAQHALKGENSFFAKREVIDEYGWRNYGDLWADHEEAYYSGPRPIVSHYNNQYDGLQGFLLSYLVTEDRRWWELAEPLARHVIDIDIYHTQNDRAVYNGGLFWHTSHYVDAHASTHRTYAKEAHPNGGGGLSNEHNYSTGLLLYYHLTGNRKSKAAVESLAEWVIGMDDGRRHVLGIVQDGPTGVASQTTVPDYHRPGRGAGNCINVLLDGWLATCRQEFLAKAEELIRRTIHPQDDVDGLHLGNAELRWSYTVYLQSMLRILAAEGEFGFSRDLLSYISKSVLNYARWMARNERFYLDRPEDLEYPTETWAAQELRKANVLVGAAAYAEPAEASDFRQKADWIYERAWSTLMKMPTRTYTRPTILSLQLGLVEAAVGSRSSGPRFMPDQSFECDGVPRDFVPQKAAFRQALRSPLGILRAGARMLRFWRWPDPLRATWTAQQLQSWRMRWLA